MRRCWVGVVALVGAFGAEAEPVPPLQQVIQVAKAQALNGAAVDWPQVEQQALALQRRAPDEGGTDAAIRYVLKALDDGHSFYIPAARAQGSGSAPAPAPEAMDQQRAAKLPRAIAHAVAAHDTHGRLTIHGWSGSGPQVVAATHQVRNALLAALAHGGCGLVLDVADNTGGNMWPMMGGHCTPVRRGHNPAV